MSQKYPPNLLRTQIVVCARPLVASVFFILVFCLFYGLFKRFVPRKTHASIYKALESIPFLIISSALVLWAILLHVFWLRDSDADGDKDWVDLFYMADLDRNNHLSIYEISFIMIVPILTFALILSSYCHLKLDVDIVLNSQRMVDQSKAESERLDSECAILRDELEKLKQENSEVYLEIVKVADDTRKEKVRLEQQLERDISKLRADMHRKQKLLDNVESDLERKKADVSTCVDQLKRKETLERYKMINSEYQKKSVAAERAKKTPPTRGDIARDAVATSGRDGGFQIFPLRVEKYGVVSLKRPPRFYSSRSHMSLYSETYGRWRGGETIDLGTGKIKNDYQIMIDTGNEALTILSRRLFNIHFSDENWKRKNFVRQFESKGVVRGATQTCDVYRNLRLQIRGSRDADGNVVDDAGNLLEIKCDCFAVHVEDKDYMSSHNDVFEEDYHVLLGVNEIKHLQSLGWFVYSVEIEEQNFDLHFDPFKASVASTLNPG